MGWGRYVPWTTIESWSCIACGGCCSEFTVILTPYEYAKLSKIYGFSLLGIDRRGNPCLRKQRGRCVFQDPRGFCELQPLGLKPMACRLWPFAIRRKPHSRSEDALFQHRGADYHVYVDQSYPCPGIGRGRPEDLPSTISELIDIWSNPSKPQRYSTSIRRNTPPIPLRRFRPCFYLRMVNIPSPTALSDTLPDTASSDAQNNFSSLVHHQLSGPLWRRFSGLSERHS